MAADGVLQWLSWLPSAERHVIGDSWREVDSCDNIELNALVSILLWSFAEDALISSINFSMYSS